MSEFTIDELRDAEIVPEQGGTNAYLVRFEEGDYELVNRTPKNRLLLETDLLDQAEGGHTTSIEVDGDDHHVTFTADVENDRYHLTVDGRRVNIPAEHEDEALEAYSDERWDDLHYLHGEIVENRVRVGLMDRFMPRFSVARDNDRLHKSEEGWVIDETFVVEWNGENYLTENVDTHIVNGGEAVRADESREARQLTFDLPDEVSVPDPAGDNSIDLGEREARFLATVECLLHPDEYLTDEEADYVDRAVENANDPIASFARTASVEGFTDERSGLYHGHGLRKHTLSMLGVTDEAEERLFYNSHDHAGVHEMRTRRNEFENAPYEVFTDAPNDSEGKWEKIEATSRKAPIPGDVRVDIGRRFQ